MMISRRTSLALGLAFALAACSSNPPEVPLAPGQPIALANSSFAISGSGSLEGWSQAEHMNGNSYAFELEALDARSAPASARIRRYGPEFFGLLEQRVRVQPVWVGKTVRLSGYLRTKGATGTGGALVLQARDGGGSILAHDHMDGRRVRGDQVWQRYDIALKVPPGTWELQVGVMLEDDGTLWADDLALDLMD